MRILAGRLKGRNVEPKGSINYRPALAIVRKALFDILRPSISPSQRFLDLFGGSGCVGIEAYSRGIDDVWINELDRGNFSAILENLRKLGIESSFRLMNRDFRAVLDSIKSDRVKFDYVFTAPPYDNQEFYPEIVRFFSENKSLLSGSGYLILEYRRRTPIVTLDFEIVKDNTYGDTKLMFLQHRRADA
jgi:16S rRNA (guanine(966)-N(2))-methyltransferase RsmD